MNQLTQRVSLFFIAIPLLISTILFLPQYNHLVWNLVVIFSSAMGGFELHKLINNNLSSKLYNIPFTGAFLPLAAYLEMSNIISDGFTALVLITLLSILIIKEVFIKNDTVIQEIIFRITGSAMLIIYPGLFMLYVIKISSLPDASYFILLFLILIFTNDSAAFVFGSLFGRKSTKIFLVSPNKSLVGFISGIVFTVLGGIIFVLLIPLPISIWQMAILSFFISIIANAGDLVESAIKRSANVKDSGSIMPGRGGMLDSIDSMLFSAPAYYFILILFIN
ncbi:MAG: phosphatidate cytidylyltransferase [Spirochaetales bacterium]|nr:phosphatidate cytidylyltransferase [Spirochaetales bacterium]